MGSNNLLRFYPRLTRALATLLTVTPHSAGYQPELLTHTMTHIRSSPTIFNFFFSQFFQPTKFSDASFRCYLILIEIRPVVRYRQCSQQQDRRIQYVYFQLGIPTSTGYAR